MKLPLTISVVLLLIGGISGNYLRYVRQEPDRIADFSFVPYEYAGYTGEERRFSDGSYEVLQADTTTLRRYRDSSGSDVGLFIAYFRSQEYGGQIHSPKHCLPGSGWKIHDLEPFELRVDDSLSISINRAMITSQTHTQLMFYWFETRAGSIRSEFGLKWDLMRNALALRPTDAAFVRVTTDVFPGEYPADATKRAVSFMRTFYRPVSEALPFDD